MNTSMGMLQGTPPVPMGDDYGASLGRGMGVAADADMATTNGPLSGQAHARHAHAGRDEIAPNANSVPNFPQDAFMEGSMMNMDAMVATPANAGLLPGWSAQMQGMMTLIRVLPQPAYDRMTEAIRNHKSDEMRMPAWTRREAADEAPSSLSCSSPPRHAHSNHANTMPGMQMPSSSSSNPAPPAAAEPDAARRSAAYRRAAEWSAAYRRPLNLDVLLASPEPTTPHSAPRKPLSRNRRPGQAGRHAAQSRHRLRRRSDPWRLLRRRRAGRLHPADHPARRQARSAP